ncbi:MAG TPA: IS1 family transposase [Candidatus Acidoferrum sp.]|nr:IS1 family transposase [Candidatus Acidoferrum sp.]
MNLLPKEKQIQIINALVEGNSIRATARMVDVEHKTVMRVLLRVGANCAQILNQRMRQLPCRFVQADEIWTYVGKKERRMVQGDNPAEVGDQYVFVAMDAETKLVPCFRVGKRNAENTWYFVQDLQGRLANRVQLTTDGFRPYLPAVEDAFGANVDYAMLIKMYSESGLADKRYSPGEIVNALPIPVSGNPKPYLISTSHIERQNLTIRMQLRRFTRLTNAFSKKLENLKAACALHFAWYNFCRIHQTLRVTPAMEAGLTERVWGSEELLAI